VKRRPSAVLLLAVAELLLGLSGGAPLPWSALAAAAALAFRPWSYALFFAAVIGQAVASGNWVGATVSSVLGGVLLLPGLRRAYFDPKLRWWESLPRYRVELNGIVETAEGAGFCQVVDASVGGMLLRLRSPRPLLPGETVKVVTSTEEQRLAIHGVVIHSAGKGRDLYGIRYLRFDLATRAEVRRFVLGCALRGVPCSKDTTPWDRLLLYMQIRALHRAAAWARKFPFRLKIERVGGGPVSPETGPERSDRGSSDTAA
jgi:hypothetical protein